MRPGRDKCCSPVLNLVPLCASFLLSPHSPRLSQQPLAVDWRTCGQNWPPALFCTHGTKSWPDSLSVCLTQELGFLTPSWTLGLEFHLFFFFFWLILFSLGWLGFGSNTLVFAEIISGWPLLLWLICGSHSQLRVSLQVCLWTGRDFVWLSHLKVPPSLRSERCNLAWIYF